MSSRLRAGLVMAASLVLATGSVTSSVAPAHAAGGPIQVTPGNLDFASVVLGENASLPLTVQNTDVVDHELGPVTVHGSDAADFTATDDSCSGVTLAAGGSCGVTVRFAPTAGITRLATLELALVDLIGPLVISLAGDGLDPISVLTPTLDYGRVPVDGGARGLLASIKNYGPAVTITGVTLTGTDAADFSIASDTCLGMELGTTNVCEVDVAFDPSAAGTRTATLELSGAFPVGTRTVSLTGYGQPASPVAWKTMHTAGPAYTWTYGGALGRSVKSGTQRLHLVYSTDRVSGKWVKDKGPFLGVYYTRSTSGSTWTKAKRLNPSTQHAERSAVAAAGSRVYAVWVTQTKAINFSNTARRVLYVRVNTAYGASTAWKKAIRISSSTGRVDYPTVAATGKDAHIAWTDAVTGKVKVTSTRNAGSTWKTTTVGTTTWSGPEGREGVPSVAAAGSLVVVAWAADQDDRIRARVSTDRGVHWGSVVTLATTSTTTVSAAARGSRVAVAWTTAEGVVVAVRSGGTWGPARIVAGPVGDQYSPAVALQGTSRVGVAWAQEDTGSSLTTLNWAESPDNGAAWYVPQVIAGTSASRETNDWASIQWPSASTRIVLWNGWTPGTNWYRQFIRTGTGSPAGLPAVAPILAVGASSAHAGATVHRRPSAGHGS